MNTKGIKFLAVLAVLAMAFAAFAVVTTTDDSDAEAIYTPSAKWTAGPLDFAYTATDSAYTDNVGLKNNITVSYQADAKKYTITGTLGYWANSGAEDPLVKVGMPAATHYALSFLALYDNSTSYTIKVGTGEVSTSISTNEPCMLSLNAKGTSTVVITGGANAGTYTLDFTGVTLSANTSSNPDIGYVALANANALAGFGSAAKDVTGTDGANGTWHYVKAANNDTATLTLTNYNGNEYFFFYGTMNMDVVLNGSNSIKVTAGTAKNGYAGDEWYALGGASDGNSARTSTIHAGASDASLSIVVKPSSIRYAMGMLQFTKIGNDDPVSGTAAKTIISVDAPYAALYNYSTTMDIDNATITATASGKVMNVYGLDLNKSSIKATLTSANYNSANGFITGIRMKDTSITMDATSVIETTGLYITPNEDALAGLAGINGKIYISGYEPKGTPAVGGLYVAKLTDTLTVSAIDGKSSSDTKGVYLVGDADYFNADGKIIVKKGSKTVENTENLSESPDAAKVAEINSTTIPSTIVQMSGNADIVFPTAVAVSSSKTVSLNTVTENASFTADVTVDDQTLKFTAVKGKFTISKGSSVIEINEWTAGPIAVGDGDTVKISGNIAGNVSFTLSGTSAKFIIEADKALNVTGSLTFPVNSNVVVSGILAGNIINNGIITVATGGDVSGATISGTGYVVSGGDSSDMDDVTISGRSSTGDIVYPANQLVTVSGTWTLVKGANVVVKGQLDVPADAKIVVEAGASLTFQNGAVFNMEGTLVIEDEDVDAGVAAAVVAADFAEMNIEGAVTIAGDLNITAISAGQFASFLIMEGSSVVVTADGTITVGANAYLVIDKEAELTVNGSLNAVAIYNYGTITINSSTPLEGNTTIYQAANDAVVDVQKLTIGQIAPKTLTITDYGLVFYSKTVNKVTTSIYVGQEAGWANPRQANTLVLSVDNIKADYNGILCGIYVSETVTSKASDTVETGYYEGKNYSNMMNIEGIAVVSSVYIGTGADSGNPEVSAILALDAKNAAKILKETGLILGLKVTLSNAATSKLTVAGWIDATAKTTSPAAQATITNAGTITLDGDGLITYSAVVAGTVKAALIETGTTDKIYNYMTIDSAIAELNSDDGVTAVSVVGDVSVKKTATVPAGATITVAAGKKVTIGSSTITDIILTIEKDATLKGNGTIDVKATLYAEQKTDVKGNTVTSDVKTEETDAAGKIVKNGWAKWTNLALALAGAESGSTVTITKDGNIELTGSTVVKEGVTLVIPETSGSLILKNGVTLTVNGTLDTANDILAEYRFALEAKNLTTDKCSAIVVNGTLILPSGYNNTYGQGAYKTAANASLKTDKAPIAGAYYTTEENCVISSLDIALYNVEYITSAITLYGAIAADEVYFEASENCDTLVVGISLAAVAADAEPAHAKPALPAIKTVFTVGTIALDGSILKAATEATGNSSFSGVVAVGEATVKLVGASAKTGDFYIQDLSSKLVLSGAFDVSDKDDLFTVATGTVYSGISGTGARALAVDTENVVFNSLVVAEGATLEAADAASTIDRVVVYGTLTIPVEKILTITTLTVYGTVDIAGATSTKTAGTLNIGGAMYIGISAADFLAANNVAGTATLSGAPTTGTKNVYVSAGATLDDAAMAALASKSKVDIYVGDSIWFTAYGSDAFTLTTAPVDDARLTNWTKVKGSTAVGDVTGLGNNNIDPDNVDVLYSIVKEDIYTVEILTDAGIKSVSIDGVQLRNAQNANFFETIANIKAGTHVVAYTLMDGYSGVAQLYTADGTILKDLKFVATGFDNPTAVQNTYKITLQLTGTEKSVEPTPEPTPTPEEKSEWTITTILLVILVILIAILVVVLILRLNRS